MTLKEQDIRPTELFDRYLALAAKDARWILDQATMEDVVCWGCGVAGEAQFEKLGYQYVECPKCRSLFASPRPSSEDISMFYEEGESPRFWATDFYRETAEARRTKLWAPKAKRVLEIIQTSRSHNLEWICDIGAGYGLFLEEIRKILPSEIALVAVEPTPALADVCQEREFRTIRKFVAHVTRGELPPGPGVFTSFELFEHLHNPMEFLVSVKSLMPPDSVFICTTLSGWGVDIRLLKQHSKAVFPPHHLNFPSPELMKVLGTQAGFKHVDVFTPGQLDVDILEKTSSKIEDPFWRLFLEKSTPEAKESMQATLAQQGFSSHMWTIFYS